MSVEQRSQKISEVAEVAIDFSTGFYPPIAAAPSSNHSPKPRKPLFRVVRRFVAALWVRWHRNTSKKLKRSVGACVGHCRKDRFCPLQLHGQRGRNIGMPENWPASRWHFLPLTAPGFVSLGFGKIPKVRAVQRVRKKSRINSTTHLPAERTGAFGAKRYKWSTRRGHRRDAPLGRMPTHLGGASIASGYTPSALAGALPQHPLPLKGCKSAIQRKAPHAKFASLKQRKGPWQRGLRIAPVSTKNKAADSAQKRYVWTDNFLRFLWIFPPRCGMVCRCKGG